MKATVIQSGIKLKNLVMSVIISGLKEICILESEHMLTLYKFTIERHFHYKYNIIWVWFPRAWIPTVQN